MNHHATPGSRSGSALRELAVQGSAAEREDDAYSVFDREAAALADPAVGENDDCFDAGEGVC